MLDNVDISKVLFLDIECVSSTEKYSDLNEDMQYLWKLKAATALKRYGEKINDEDAEAAYMEKAGIYAEFGKIICISVGIVFRNKDKNLQLRLKTFANHDEKKLLEDFNEMLAKYYPNPNTMYFCGHNIKEFDIPYMCRRMIINYLKLPPTMNIAGKKPWETKHLLDTMELWKFGDRKSWTSLKLLAGVLGFPSPKDDIDGSEVGRVYWADKDLERIGIYCEKDVLATVQLFLRYKLLPLLIEEQISSATKWGDIEAEKPAEIAVEKEEEKQIEEASEEEQKSEIVVEKEEETTVVAEDAITEEAVVEEETPVKEKKKKKK